MSLWAESISGRHNTFAYLREGAATIFTKICGDMLGHPQGEIWEGSQPSQPETLPQN